MRSNSEVNAEAVREPDATQALRLRLFAVLVIIGLLPVIGFGAYVYSDARTALREQASERLRGVASTRQRQIERWIDTLSSSLYRTLVAVPTLPEVLRDGEITPLTEPLNAAFEAGLRTEAEFSEITLVSVEDRVRYSTNAARFNVPKRLCLQSIVCASEFLTENGQTRLIVQYPIVDNRRNVVGALLGLAPLRTLDEILSTRNGLGGSGVAYIAGAQNNIRWLPGQGEQPIVIDGLRLEQSVQVTDGGVYRGLAGGSAVGATAFIPRLFSWIVVEQTTAELDNPISGWPLLMGAVGLLIIAAALVGSRILVGPVRQTLSEQQKEARKLRLELSRTKEYGGRRARTIAEMGHELRTPINAILNASGFLNDGLFGALTPDQSEMTTQIHSSSQHLLEVINDLLDISQYEAGGMKLYIQEYDPAPLFEQVIGTLNSLTLGKPIRVEADLPRGWPTMRGDRRRTLQILLNLASNAAKFTAQGTITLRAHLFTNRLEVRLEDSGPGVDLAAADHLFEPFQDGHNARGQEQGGMGLGLPLSRIFARMHGGELRHEPGELSGAVFILTIPIRVTSESAPATTVPPSDATADKAPANPASLDSATAERLQERTL